MERGNPATANFEAPCDQYRPAVGRGGPVNAQTESRPRQRPVPQTLLCSRAPCRFWQAPTPSPYSHATTMKLGILPLARIDEPFARASSEVS